MGAEGLSIEISDDGDEGDHLVVLKGELDMFASAELAQVLDEVAHSTVVVDLSGLTFIDASGINTFLRAQQLIEQRGDKLKLVRPNSWIRNVFRLGGLEHLLS